MTVFFVVSELMDIFFLFFLELSFCRNFSDSQISFRFWIYWLIVSISRFYESGPFIFGRIWNFGEAKTLNFFYYWSFFYNLRLVNLRALNFRNFFSDRFQNWVTFGMMPITEHRWNDAWILIDSKFAFIEISYVGYVIYFRKTRYWFISG